MRRSVLGNYKKGAVNRGLVWQLSEEEFDKLTSDDCHYCGNPPANTYSNPTYNGKFIYNGIDRKDNSQGYVTTNVVSCCRECNKAKRDTPYLEFIAFLLRAGQFILRQTASKEILT